MNTIGKGAVRFYYPARDGSYLYSGHKSIKFIFVPHLTMLENFAEGLRSSCYIGKESTKAKYAIYEFEDSIAFCDIIINLMGEYVNKHPIMLNDWKNYGAIDEQKFKSKNGKRQMD